MIPSFPGAGDPKQHRLLKLFKQLDRERQQQLLDFAEFLLQKDRDKTRDPDLLSADHVQEPLTIPRPEQETVVAAIKRLSKTYAMLSKDEMLHQTSDLMSEHILKGRPASEVIDDLEIMFIRQYEIHLERFNNQD